MADTPEVSAAEAAIEPEIEVVDTHFHLSDRTTPPYQLDDFVKDASSGHRVVQGVFVESGWKWNHDLPDRALISVAEVRAAAECAADARERPGVRIDGIVGFADFSDPATVQRAIDASIEVADGLLVGVRSAACYDADPKAPVHRTRPRPGLMQETSWQESLKQVARRGLTFDCLVFHSQLPEVVGAVSSVPEATFVLNHLGLPLGMGRYEGKAEQVMSFCREYLSSLARYPNVYLKIGGIATPVTWQLWGGTEGGSATSAELAAAWGSHVRWCVETFGPDRCMFESNFPVDRATCSYVAIWNAFKLMVKDASSTEKQKLFAGTARRAYRLPARTS